MKVRNRILLLSSLLLLVSVGGIGNLMWQMPRLEQMHDLKAVFHVLILLGLFGVGLIFSVLELVRQEIMSPIFQLAAQIARLKEREIDGHRLELTGSKDIDLLTRALNDLLDGFQKEEDLYRIFAEASPDMIYLLDRDGRVLFGNLNAARQWNYRPEEIIGKRQEELFPPDIAARHKQAVEKIFDSGQPIFIDVHETIGQHKRRIDARMVPVLNKDGRVTAVLGISRDITERKKAEKTILELSKFPSENPSPVLRIAKDGEILYSNKPGLELLAHWNVKIGEKAPEKWRRLIKEALESAKLGLQEEEEEEEAKSKIFSIVISPVVEAGYVNLYARDITKHKGLEERLTKVNKCLLSLGPDFHENVSRITALCGELFAGTCALYNRLADNMLYATGSWHTPPDFNPRDKPDGHICYDVIQGVFEGDMLVVPDLLATRYAETDSNVRRYGLHSYMGHAVHCGQDKVGALCVVFQQRFSPTENDKKLFGILASAISVEESRHAAEQATVKSTQRFQTLVETTSDWIWEVDAQGHYTYASPRCKDLLGYESEELLDKTPFDLMPPDEARRVRSLFEAIAAERKPFANLENINLHKDGRGVILETSGMPILDDQGNLIGYRGIDRDITKRKRADEVLKESEAKFKALFASAPEGIIVADLQAKQFRYANPAMCRMFGYTEEEFMRLGVADIHPKESLDHVISEFMAPARGEKLMLLDLPCLRKDGTVFYANISGIKIFIDDRECRVGFFTDISEHKRAEQKVTMLSDAIENAHHGCLIISEDYKVVFANNYALTKLGFESDELKNLDLFSLCADREQVKDIIETMKVTKRWMGEIAIIKKDGKQFPALMSVTALGADGDASSRGGSIILFQDITIQKEMREKLLTSEKLAVMGRLTADVAHELNNPLAIVIGGTQLMMSRIDEKPQEVKFKSQLETVLRNARRCKTILSNLLGYGRTIGKKEEAVNLPNLIREAIDDVNYQHDMSAIETVFNYSELAVAEITGNRSALLSVFVNLIRNARQAMGEKGRLTVTIEKEDAKHLRIEIHDTGIGMNKEQKTKLFKPFTSGWKEATSAQKALSGHLPDDVVEGSGLGLATSLGIIETHGGCMSAESEGVGKGATFTILLPCEFKGKKG